MSEKPPKYTQRDLFSEKIENKKVEPLDMLVSSERGDDRYSKSEPDIKLYFDGADGFFIDNKKASVGEFLSVMGVRRETLYTQRPELREKFEKELYYENLRKKTGGEIDESENEKMQQALNKK